MSGTSMRNGQSNPFEDFSEDVRELSIKFFRSRETYSEESLRLLNSNQRFLKKLEDLKYAKKELRSQRNNYVDQSTVFALRDAELRYQKACMLETEKEWTDMIGNRHEEIKTFRQELQKQLQHYCEERRKTAAVQSKVTTRTEEDRINALNSVAFCTYAQTMVEGEVKKLCAAAGLPTTRNIQRLQTITSKALHSAKQELQLFYEEKIKEFKRQERILYGRGRDAVDLPRPLLLNGNDGNNSNTSSSNNNNNNNSNPSSSSMGNNSNNSGNANNGSDITAEMLVDTLENRIATKLIAMDPFHPESLPSRGTADVCEEFNSRYNNSRTSAMLQPAPPLSSSSAKLSSSNNNNPNSARRNISTQSSSAANNKPPTGKSEPTSSPLRASTLQQHQQRLLMQQQQQQQQSLLQSPMAHNNLDNRSGHRRYSLLQNGGLIPAVSVSTVSDKNNNKGNSRLAALASATTGKDNDTKNPNPAVLMSKTTGQINPTNDANINNTNNNISNASPSTTKKKKHGGKSKKNGKHAAKEDEVLYDPNRYIPACASDFVKPHTLLDLTSPAVAEREERLLQLADASCEIRGRVAHMTFLRDALDGLLMRQIACLLTVLTHNQPLPLPLSSPGAQMLMVNLQQPVSALVANGQVLPPSETASKTGLALEDETDAVDASPQALLQNPAAALAAAVAVLETHEQAQEEDAMVSSFHRFAADPGKKKALQKLQKEPLNLSAAHKIIQLDCAQKEQDIHILRDRIKLLLQRPSDSPPPSPRAPYKRMTMDNNVLINLLPAAAVT